MTGRILALDYGTKRIGLAISDQLKLFAKPLATIPNTGFPEVLSAVQQIIQTQSVEYLVIGMPYAIDGSYTPKTRETEEFADMMKESLGIPVYTWDERYSSQEAEAELKSKGKSWQEARKMVDAVAAAMILKSYLENLDNA
ncbi:MAG: Holliday junction resolvase RuvX [Candidatus Cloacimonetes bacterium]|nr:Holliday junction resolvase RuvX [Candidatus Cloacimonadota bacterium]